MKYNIKSTASTREDTVAILVFGRPGVGKTRLMSTVNAEDSIILNFDGGTLSLQDCDIPTLDCTQLTMRDIAQVFDDALNDASVFKGKKWICLDSISRMAEMVLEECKATHRDGRAAYGAMGEFILPLLRRMKVDPHHNWYITAQAKREQTERGNLFMPMLPGSALSGGIAYHLSLVAYLDTRVTAEGRESALYFESAPGDTFDGVKSRAGNVHPCCEPDLSYILDLVQGREG